jgi:hypothetical protein
VTSFRFTSVPSVPFHGVFYFAFPQEPNDEPNGHEDGDNEQKKLEKRKPENPGRDSVEHLRDGRDCDQAHQDEIDDGRQGVQAFSRHIVCTSFKYFWKTDEI